MIVGDVVYGPSSYCLSYLTAEVVAAGNSGKEEDDDLVPTVDLPQIVSGYIITVIVKERPPLLRFKPSLTPTTTVYTNIRVSRPS